MPRRNRNAWRDDRARAELQHDGIYRFDGWERVTTTAGSSGGGTWSRKRKHNEAANGPKTLWLWKYPEVARVAA